MIEKTIIFKHKETGVGVALYDIKQALRDAVEKKEDREPTFAFFNYKTCTRWTYKARDIVISDDFEVIVKELYDGNRI